MPAIFSIFIVICAICSASMGAPILDDLFQGFVRESQLASEPAKSSPIVKRRIYAENADAQLKQISLQSLIGNVEDNLFNTALSVSHVAHNEEAIVPEVTPSIAANADERALTKRATEENEGNVAKNGQFVTTTESVPEGKNILLQTTKKVPAANGVPAHILIDRVSVQPHEGSLPLIPAFQIYHSKIITATLKDTKDDANKANGGSSGSSDGNPGITKISIAHTSAAVPVLTITTVGQPTPTAENLNVGESTVAATAISADVSAIAAATETTPVLAVAPATNLAKPVAAATTTTVTITKLHGTSSEKGIEKGTTTNPDNGSSTSSSASSTTTVATTIAATTTKPPIVQLKEAEEELKEKVAEIEAEPIILTSRV